MVVTVELWKKGDPNRREVLGVAVIANDATGTPSRGNYRAAFSKRGVDPEKFAREARGGWTWRRGAVTGWPRKRELVWNLLLRCLAAVYGQRAEFVECDTCRAKPGSPVLCAGCFANRATITRLSGR